MPITLCFASWNVANDGRLEINVMFKKAISDRLWWRICLLRENRLLDRLQLIIAWITDAYIEFKAHNRYIDAIHRAFITNGAAAMSTMMLPNTCFGRHELFI